MNNLKLNEMTIDALESHVDKLRSTAFPKDGSKLDGQLVREYSEANSVLAKRKSEAQRTALLAKLAAEDAEHKERVRTLLETARRCGMDSF